MLFCLHDWLTNTISYSQTNEDGCFSTEVNTKIFHRKHGDNYDFNLEAEAFLKESGTGRKKLILHFVENLLFYGHEMCLSLVFIYKIIEFIQS